MTKQQLLIAAAAVVLFAGGVWLLNAHKAEAPVTAQIPGPVVNTEATTTTSNVGSTTQEASTTLATPNILAPAVKSSPKPAVAPKPTYTLVSYDGQNFSPHKVSIAKGGVVRFLNISNSAMWIASGIHPLHNEYPIRTTKSCAPTTFDQCAAVERGGYWDFKFDVEGTWDYHNDKNVISGGIVRVLLPNER